MIPDFMIRRRLAEYLEEDLFYGDITRVEDRTVKAVIVSKDTGTLAGARVAEIAFDMFGVDVLNSLPDGERIRRGDTVMEIEGSSADVLMLERTVLNIIARMSGIATATAEMVERARSVNPEVKIAATRKTTPGFRMFEKMAVAIGGGDPHRFGLGDCVLVKDNHVAVAGNLVKAIRIARMASFTKKIEVEVRSVKEALMAAREGADIVMLDNFSVEDVRRAIKLLEGEGLRDNVIVEASGGITPENVAEYAETGVDVISSGYITHSARSLDFSLRVL